MAKMLWGSMGSMLRALFIGTLILLLLLYTRKIFPVDASSQAARRPQDVHVQQGKPPSDLPPPYSYRTQNIVASDKVIVTPKQRTDSIDWMRGFCREFGCAIVPYSMDPEPEPGMWIPETTQGHEAGAYLSYIVEFYNDLPAYSIFIHSNEEQWHNDMFGPRTADYLRNLRFEAVDAQGFVNLRCTTAPLCPDSWHLLSPQKQDLDYMYLLDYLPKIYAELFNTTEDAAPQRTGNLCCAQFVISRDRIRRRPRSDYERMLRWVATTDVSDNYGIGFFMEKMWHIVFGLEPVYCPRYEQCRCDVYGWCGPLPSGEVLTPITVDR